MTETRALASWEHESVEHWRTAWRLPELVIFESASSTNDVVKQRAEHGATAGTTAIADVQTHGRGRRERKWDTPAGTALLMSMLFRPTSHSPADFAGTIPLRAGMAAARAIESVCDVDVWLKWPNDVLATDGRKIAGILCESSLSSTGLTYTVVGIGINVLQTHEQLHDDGTNLGTSLRVLIEEAHAASQPPVAQSHAARVATISRSALAGALVGELLKVAVAPATALTQDELAEYAARDSLADHDVTADGAVVGTVNGIGAFGELRVRDGNDVRSIHAGTIRRIR